MALACPVCKSDECQHLLGDMAQCRSCNAHFLVNTGEVVTETLGGSTLPDPTPPEAEPVVEDEPAPVVEDEPEPEPEPEPVEVSDGVA